MKKKLDTLDSDYRSIERSHVQLLLSSIFAVDHVFVLTS